MCWGPSTAPILLATSGAPLRDLVNFVGKMRLEAATSHTLEQVAGTQLTKEFLYCFYVTYIATGSVSALVPAREAMRRRRPRGLHCPKSLLTQDNGVFPARQLSFRRAF